MSIREKATIMSELRSAADTAQDQTAGVYTTVGLPPTFVTREEAAACLAISPEEFDEHVLPTLARVPVSPDLLLFRLETLRAWVERREADPPRD